MKLLGGILGGGGGGIGGMIGGVVGGLLRFAFPIVGSIMGQLTSQMNVVAEQAVKPINDIIKQVGDGQWIGEGANAFVKELSSVTLPDINKGSDDIDWLNKGLQKASDLISDADQGGLPLIGELADAASSIIGF